MPKRAETGSLPQAKNEVKVFDELPTPVDGVLVMQNVNDSVREQQLSDSQAKNTMTLQMSKSEQNSKRVVSDLNDENVYNSSQITPPVDVALGEGLSTLIFYLRMSPEMVLVAAMLKSHLIDTILNAEHRALLDHCDMVLNNEVLQATIPWRIDFRHVKRQWNLEELVSDFVSTDCLDSLSKKLLRVVKSYLEEMILKLFSYIHEEVKMYDPYKFRLLLMRSKNVNKYFIEQRTIEQMMKLSEMNTEVGVNELTASHHLKQQRFYIAILEARDRIGGHVYIDCSSLSVIVDLGAMISEVEVDVSTKRRPDLSSLICEHLGVELIVLNSVCPFYDIVFGLKVTTDINVVVGSFLKYYESPERRFFVTILTRIHYGQSISVCGLARAISLAEYKGGLWTIKGGKYHMVAGLIKSSNISLHINEEIASISYLGAYYEFNSTKGNSYSCDVTVVATPLDEVNIQFTPSVSIHARKLQHTHATFVRGSLNQTYFGLCTANEIPEPIDTLEDLVIPFSSISVLKQHGENDVTYKVLSRELMTDVLMDALMQCIDASSEQCHKTVFNTCYFLLFKFTGSDSNKGIIVEQEGHERKLNDIFSLFQETRNTVMQKRIVSYSSLMGAGNNARIFDPGGTFIVTATMTKAVQQWMREEFQRIEYLRTSTRHKKIAYARHDFISFSTSENKLKAFLRVLKSNLLAKAKRAMENVWSNHLKIFTDFIEAKVGLVSSFS
ncbi:hypothetical protein GQ457_13G021380 [Hibiscus cannabinus]